MNYKKDTKKGYYRPINPDKYMGTKPPIFKSNWEKKAFYALDVNPNVSKWGYECIEIYYNHPIFNKFTVYYPDIFCHIKNVRGKEETLLVEIKPAKMCVPPKKVQPPKNKNAKSWDRYRRSIGRYQAANREFVINRAKWDAAELWCMKHKVRWVLSNEVNSGFNNITI